VLRILPRERRAGGRRWYAARVPGQVGDDVPTGQLAKLIAPRVVFSEDRHLRQPGLAPTGTPCNLDGRMPRTGDPAGLGGAPPTRESYRR
jgi:hypothetical protein